MSLCELGSLGVDTVGDQASSEEPAIVPDIQEYHYNIFSNPQSCKRYRSSSNYFSGEEEGEDLLEQNQQNYNCFLNLDTKRHCSSYSISNSPEEVFQPNSYCETAETYFFGASKDEGILTCGVTSPPVSSSTALQPSSLDFASSGSKGPSANCEQNFDSQALPASDFLSDMQQSPVLGHRQTSPHFTEYELIIKEQPEEYYRARYDSEGVRAPLKGLVENYPSVQIFGPDFRYGRIDVKLVHEDGTPHTSCSLDASEGRKNAVMKKIGPFNHMIAEFEDLRIRRVKKEGRKKPTGGDKSAPKDGRSDKTASLLFTAFLETEHGEIVQSIKSRPISLTTAPEPAELDWLEPNRGHFAGQEPLVIKGSKMTSPKVTFRIHLPDGRRHELHGSVDKERSHQNVLLVKTPSLNQLSYQFAHQTVRAEVIVITGRNQMLSNPLPFHFIPNNVCRECMQETPMTTAYAVCSSNAIPSFPTTAAAISISGHSPPPTPGPPPQPSPSPTALRAQMQTPNPMQMPPQSQPSYSQTSIPVVVSSESISPSTSARSLISSPDMVPSFPEAGTISTASGKGRDDIMYIVEDFMRQDCATTSSSVGLSVHHKDMESQYLYSSNAYVQQLEGHVSSPYIPVTSPSAASDQPCYSPITPVQSPLPTSPWNYIEQMLTTLLRTEQITHQDFRVLQEHCVKQNPYLLQAFNASQSNETVFLQMLAFNKLEQSYQTTHQ